MSINLMIRSSAFRLFCATFLLLGLSHSFVEARPNQVPRLLSASATQRTPNASSTYLFTIKIPSEATHSVKALVITQRSGLEDIVFIPDHTQAVLGDKLAKGAPLSLASVGGEVVSDKNEVLVVFDEPVEPGNTVTVAVKVRRNPSYGGNYQFGVTAFADYDDFSLYLGTVRLHFFGHN